MANPSHLLLDSDVLIQVFMTRQTKLLNRLKAAGMVPAVVPEVEGEIRYHQRFRDRFEPAFLSAKDRAVIVFDRTEVRRLLLARGVPEDAIENHHRTLEARAVEYHRHVGEGEAHTHALASELNLPAASNDGEALRILSRQGLAAAQPTLRFFDLLVFGLRRGWVDEATCSRVCGTLRGDREYVPHPFPTGRPFSECAREFSCRLGCDQSPADEPLDTRNCIRLNLTP